MEKLGHMLRRASDRNRAGYGMDRMCTDPGLLHERIEELEHTLSVERQALAQARADGELLREANTQLVRATFGAQDQKELAESANRRQKVFLSMLAHELNNPIAAILTANSFMLATRMLNARAARMAAIVGRQASHLHRLVDDLLDVARINTGKVCMRISLGSLHELIDGAVELSMPALEERHQQVELDLPAAAVMLNGDMVRLTQLFSNLLINASKFSPPHTPIVVTARGDGQVLSVSVKDQGIGIAPEDQARIFELFTQAQENGEHGAASGLGIGLALVKHIAELHGGSVSVSSGGAGCGSEFTVVLPLP